MMEYTKRELTEDEKAVIDELYKKKAEHKNTHAYVTTKNVVELHKWNGRHPSEDKSNWTAVPIQPGVTLKVVMVSRFGDCGLTDDLNAEHGYHLRLEFDNADIVNIRRNP